MQQLVAVSSAQLALGVAGLVVALRRGHAYDLPWLHGDPARLPVTAPTLGTAYSAPGVMLIAQATLTARAARRPTPPVVRGLGGLGAAMVGGYLGERQVRRRLRPSGWDALETPLVAIAITLAAGMAVLGLGRPAAGR